MKGTGSPIIFCPRLILQAVERPAVGGGVSIKPIEDSASYLRQQFQVQVIAPLSSWLSAYKSIKASAPVRHVKKAAGSSAKAFKGAD